MGQAWATIDVRLQVDYRILNKAKDEDSKWEQVIYLWQGLTLKQFLKEMTEMTRF